MTTSTSAADGADSATSRGDRPALNRQRVLQAAVDLADEEGIDQLSMRRLAKRLDFEVMSLYNHVANKADLLSGMTDLVAAEVDEPPADLGWMAALRAHSVSLRNAFARHPWAVTLWATSPPGPSRFDLMEWQLATLASADLPEDIAHNAFHAVNNHIVGYMLANALIPFADEELEELTKAIIDQLDGHRHRRVIEHIRQHQDGQHGPSFEYVLDLILDGLHPTGR